MHAAPSVTYPVGRSAFAARFHGAIALLGLLAVAAWGFQSSGGWRPAAGLGAVLAAAAYAVWSWWRTPAGTLRWDGADWRWQEQGADSAGIPVLSLDLQSRMLLRFRPHEGPVRWLWVERASDPSHWDALRRAVYSRASMPGAATGKPPAAEQ
jgi:toxin CptA